MYFQMKKEPWRFLVYSPLVRIKHLDKNPGLVVLTHLKSSPVETPGHQAMQSGKATNIQLPTKYQNFVELLLPDPCCLNYFRVEDNAHHYHLFVYRYIDRHLIQQAVLIPSHSVWA